MFEFYVYETVTLSMKVNPSDVLDNLYKLVITLKQGKNQFDFEDGYTIDGEESIINLYLDQEQTGQFKPGKIQLQVNFYYQDKERDTSTETSIMALDNLYKKVMT